MVLAGLTACFSAKLATTPEESGKEIANLTYQTASTENGRAPLTDGSFEDVFSHTAISVSTHTAFGDLNGDQLLDAAVILISRTGGTGVYRELAAVLQNGRGRWTNVDTVFLGDRIRVENVQVADGLIRIRMRVHAETDPLCCPQIETVRRFKLKNKRLVQFNGP